MSREKLAEKIMSQCAHDGEFVTYAEALEMAEMELKAKGIKNYTESADSAEKIAKKSRKRNISDEKKQIFNKSIFVYIVCCRHNFRIFLFVRKQSKPCHH